MNPMNRWMRLIAVLAALLMVATACGSDDDGATPSTDDSEVTDDTAAPDEPSDDEEAMEDDEPITLTVWTQLGDNPVLSETLDALNASFMEENPNVTVELEHQTFDNLSATVPTALSSGSGPDIIDYDANAGTIGALSDTGLLVDLEPYFQEFGWDDQLFPWVKERVTFANGPVGVGRSNEVVGIYYNNDIFTDLGIDPPDTYAQFLAAADALAAADITPVAFANQDQWPASHFLGVAVHASVPNDQIRGFETLGESGTWNSAEVVSALEAAVGWVDSGYVLDGFNGLAYDDGNGEFYAGRAGMHITGTWLAGDIAGSMEGIDVRFTGFPMIDESLPFQAEGGIGGAWAISSSSESQDAAAAWIDFVHFADESEAAWVAGGVLPTTNFDIASGEVPQLLQDNFAVLERASAEGGIGYWLGFTADPIVGDTFTSSSQLVLDGSTSIPDYLEGLDDALADARDS